MLEISGFVFPNDIHVAWSLMIVMYPYITGFVAGSFIVTSLYHLFGRTEFKPVARLAMATAFAFALVATVPLNLHLGNPSQGPMIMVTPHFTSAMAGFSILYGSYLVIMILEIWFVWRVEIIEAAKRSRGAKRFMYKALALFTYDTSPEAIAIDHRAVSLLAGLGLPAACMLHGYVGFMFGAIKANPWWSTPLMPVIFLMSAAVSGIALLVLVYQVYARLAHRPVVPTCMAALARWLWFFLILTISLELLELLAMAYERSESWIIISQLLTTRLEFSYVTIQMIVGGLIPLILLAVVVLMNQYLHERVRNTLSTVAALLCLLQVFSMRWNIVIGGQLLSKSLRGLRAHYEPELWGREGVVVAMLCIAAPFLVLVLFDRILGIEEPSAAAGSTQAPADSRASAGQAHGVDVNLA